MPAPFRHYLEEVREALWPHRHAGRSAFLPGYLNTKRVVVGLDAATQRRIAKNGFSFFQRSPAEVNQIWDYIWQNATEHEVLAQALIYYQNKRESIGPVEWRFLRHWVNRIDNWAHSDQLSDLYAHIHERYPSLVYPTYLKWNKSRNPWAVRQSLVGLFYYAQSREKQPSFSKALRLVKGAFSHPNVYVQKGVGWTLREMYNVYPERTTAFLFKNAVDLSATAWQASTEKLPTTTKRKLKILRKQ